MENKLIPYQATQCISANSVVVFAPHPDDEVFGCGGAILRHVAAGVPVHVVILSDGAFHADDDVERQTLVEIREAESRKAAVVLGYGEPEFWRLPDRGVIYGEALVRRIADEIQNTAVNLVYAPSLMEMHPDHRAVAMCVIEAVRRAPSSPLLALYEVGVPIAPNLLLDISDLAECKMAAMACFVSQNEKQRYDLGIAALNRYRTYTLSAEVTAAEAYIVVSAEKLANDPFKIYQSEHKRQRELGLALDVKDMPLVSVIIRSMDRPTLSESLDSVALQTYPNIEVVVVNAKGEEHSKLDEWCGHFPLLIVDTGEMLQRSRAGNVGLSNAHGDYLIFLDDDDWFMPEHVSMLMDVLTRNPDKKAAYSGVTCVNEQKQAIGQNFGQPFDRTLLLAGNYIPIHAVLFSRSIVDSGCRMDESFDLYEDWDFWLQAAAYSDFIFVPHVSAYYRIGGQFGHGVRPDPLLEQQVKTDLYKKWCKKWRREDLFNIMSRIERYEAKLNNVVADRDGQIAGLNQAVADREGQIVALYNSNSWRVTRLLRLPSRLLRGELDLVADVLRIRLIHYGRRLYWCLPVQVRIPLLHWCYRNLGPLFEGLPHYKQWKCADVGSCTLPADSNTADSNTVDSNKMLMIDTLPQAPQAKGRIAIHLHMYYHELADEFSQYLKNMPFEYDLYVSVASEEGFEVCQKAFSGLANQRLLTIEQVPNHGRDIAPMFCTFGSRLKDYDYIAHLHSKKSLYNMGATEGWRQYLCGNLLGSNERIRRIFMLMQSDSPRGIVYPQNYMLLPYQANTWLANKAAGIFWCARLGISPVPQGYFDFPAGTMFWAKGDALKPLFDAGITLADFPEETGQTDGTFAHCLERLLVLSSLKQGYNPGIIKDLQYPTWSAWGFHHVANRPFQYMSNQLANPAVKLIAFDIFDTLLCRPLLDPESTKAIVAERVGGESGQLYMKYRPIAEGKAREAAGRDVEMAEIFARLGKLTGLSDGMLAQLRSFEENIEKASLGPRSGVVELYQRALETGKPVVLISDMFLPRAVIEESLLINRISGWNMLFLSNEIGLRKDTGELYDYVFDYYGIAPAEMLMVGDNERSDFQIPCDKGVVGMHVLRPVEFARGLPRFRSLIEANERSGDINRELTLGLVVRENFSAINYPRLDTDSLVHPTPFNIGYSLIGPLLVGFSQWLLETSRRDGIDRLYFLAREGQLIKLVYDLWSEGLEDSPQADYLIVSRRAVSVPTLKNFEDIMGIAKATYFPNTINNFLYERYGLQLSAERWDEVNDLVQWGSNSTVEVDRQQIDHLLPLLNVLGAEIIAAANLEHTALKHYLGTMGLDNPGRQAVVDIGYGGTIQDYLNRLVAIPVHGYYMMTDQRSAKVTQKHNVIVRGCYLQDVEQAGTSPLMYLRSFELEKFLSSNDAQVVRYELDQENNLTALYRELSNDETSGSSFRTELQLGAIRYASDACSIRKRILPSYKPSCAIAKQLYEAFIAQQSQLEKELLLKVALDDHYSGRGIVR